MQQLFAIILCFILVVNGTQLGHAQSQAPSGFSGELNDFLRSYGASGHRFKGEDYQKFLKNQRRVRARSKFKKAGGKVQQIVAHQAQAILLILMITMIDIVKQHHEYSEIKSEDIDQEQLWGNLGQSADEVLNSTEIWASLFGVGLVGIATSPALLGIYKQIEDSAMRPILKRFLQSGSLSLITFVGWDAGGELFSLAVELIENDRDYERAQYLGLGTWVSAHSQKKTFEQVQFFKKKFEGSPLEESLFTALPENYVNSYEAIDELSEDAKFERAEDRRVGQLVLDNVLYILLEDDDYRNLWISNTFKKRVFTGDYAAIVGAVALSSAVLAGSGLILGFFGSVAIISGVVLFVPDRTKDSVTTGFQDLRSGVLRAGFDTKGLGFKVRKKIIELAMKYISQGKPLPPLLKYPKDKTALDGLTTIQLEKLFKLQSKLDAVDAQWVAAKDAGSEDIVDELTLEKKELEALFLESHLKIRRLHSEQIQYLESIIEDNELAAWSTKENLEAYPILNDIRQDLKESLEVAGFLNFFLDHGRVDRQSEVYLRSLHSFYLFGFHKLGVLHSLQKSKTEKP